MMNEEIYKWFFFYGIDTNLTDTEKDMKWNEALDVFNNMKGE